MEKKYVTPEMEIDEFEAEDIITASLETPVTGHDQTPWIP